MPRQERLDFDFDDYFNSTLQNTAVLMWHTTYQPHTFAFYIKHLYNIALKYTPGIVFDTKYLSERCRLYRFYDNIRRLAYFLIDSSALPGLPQQESQIFDKTLIIIGQDAHSVVQRIYNDINSPATHIRSSLSQDREEMRKTFVNTGILESAIFDFTDPEHPATTYFTGTPRTESLRKKQLRFLKEQRAYICDILIAIDSFLPDYDVTD